MFRLTPFVMVGVMLTIATALPVVTVASPLPVLGDLITLIYLFAIARFFFAIAGPDTGSPFTGIGASREAMLGVLVEPILLLGLWVAAQVAGSTHISFITDTVYHWPVSRSLPLVLALCACAFATFIEMGKLPFDLAEAEQELQEGPLTEYSGYGFAVLKWGISLKQLVVLQMFVGVSSRGADDALLRAACCWPWWWLCSSCLSACWSLPCLKTAWRACVLSKRHALPGWFWFCIFSVRLLAGGVIKESVYV